MYLKKTIILGVVLFALSINLFSQTDEVQTIKVRAKKEVLDPTMTSLATTIITEDEIKATGANNVAEVLQYTAGLLVRESASQQVAQFRGANQNHTLVLVNGRKQAAAQNLFHDLAQYNVQNVERIEIIKGAAATRYGANSIGGVINIITKDRVDRLSGLEAGIRYGSYNSVTANILGNLSYGSLNQGSVFISGSFTTNSRNYKINDETLFGDIETRVPNNEILSGDIRIGNSYRFNEEGDILHASFGFLYEDRNAPGTYYYDGKFDDGSYNYKSQKYSADISYEHYSFDLFNFFIDASTLYQTVENGGEHIFASTHNAFNNYTTEANFIIERQDNWGDVFTFNNNIELSYVNDYFIMGATTKGTVVIPEGDTASRNTISVAYLPTLGFLNYENTDVSRITIIPAIRFDAIIGTSDIVKENRNFYEPTYSLGLMYTFDQERRYIMKGNVATAYRTPTFNDLYYKSSEYNSPNPDLKKEDSISGDIGFIITPINMVRLEASYYINSVNNLIVYIPDAVTYISTPQNVDEAMLQGLDMSISINIPIASIFSVIEVSGNYAYQFEADGTRIGEGDFRLPFAPEHSATGILSYIYEGNNNIFSGRLNFLVNYSGEVFANYKETDLIEDYTTFDITASMTFIEYITLEGGVRNLLDLRYDTGFNFQAPGREFYIALSGRI